MRALLHMKAREEELTRGVRRVSTGVKKGLRTCVQNSNAKLRGFLVQNSWTTLSVSMVV